MSLATVRTAALVVWYAVLATLSHAQACPSQNAGAGVGVWANETPGFEIAMEYTTSASFALTGFSFPCWRVYGPGTTVGVSLYGGSPGNPSTLLWSGTAALPSGPGSVSATFGTPISVSSGASLFIAFTVPGTSPATGVRLPIANTTTGMTMSAGWGRYPPGPWGPYLTPAPWMFSFFCTTIAPPTITSQPQNQTKCVGASATFGVSAAGTPPLSYQWRRNAAPISGANSPAYTDSSVSLADAGNYSCVVSNAYGSVTSSSASLVVLTGPVITAQSQSVTTCAGSLVTLSVFATGSSPLSYQWRANGIPVAGGTSSSLSVTALPPPLVYGFDCVVSNTCGTATSTVAFVTGQVAPVIVTQPLAQSVCAGEPLTLTVAATGTALTYQWRKTGSAIAGATSPTYSIASASTANSGSYGVDVENLCDVASSNSVQVTVGAVPVANFSRSPNNGCAPLQVTFTNTSSVSSGSIILWNWNFGPAGTSNQQVPQNPITFSTPGVHNVTLTVTTNLGCTDSVVKTVTVWSTPVVGAISASMTCGVAPLSVIFSAPATQSPTSWAWDLNGDGFVDSIDTAPTYTYSTPGIYSVIASAANCAGTGTSVAAGLVEVSSAAPEALLQYQFNEVVGMQTANSGFFCGGGAPEHATVSGAGWQSDPGRPGFGGPEPGAGCVGRGGPAIVSTGYDVDIPGSYTVMWWHRMGPSAPQGGNNQGFRVFMTGGNFWCETGHNAGDGLECQFRDGGGGGGGGGGGATSVTSVTSVQGSPLVWQHVALVVDKVANTARFYFDGQPDGAVATWGAAAGNELTLGSDLVIGGPDSPGGAGNLGPFSQYYDLDDFRLYLGARTQAQIQADMLSEAPAATRFGSATGGGALGPPHIGSSGPPAVGNGGFAVWFKNAQPSSSGYLVLGSAAGSTGGAPLPMDLAPLGLPGILLHVSPDVLIPVTTGPGAGNVPLGIPNLPALKGMHGYLQFGILGSVVGATEGLDVNIE